MTPYSDFRIWTRFLRKYTYTPVLSDLTLTPGPLQIFRNCKPWNEADLYVQQLQRYEKSPVWLGWLRIVSLNFLITLANETFILDDGNCIVTVK